MIIGDSMNDMENETKLEETPEEKVSEEKKKIDFEKILNNIWKAIKRFFLRYWPLMLMNVIIFVLTVFVEGIYFNNLTAGWAILNAAAFIIVPTIIFNIWGRVTSEDIILSIPMLYILFLISLGYCTLRDLYWITDGAVDMIPAFLDALFVVFIFTFIEYIPSFIVTKLKRVSDYNKQMAHKHQIIGVFFIFFKIKKEIAIKPIII